MNKEELKAKIVRLHREYGIDKMELSKIMVIASTTLLVVSIHSVMSFQSAHQKVSDANSELSEASAVVNSEQFQQGMDSISRLTQSRFTNQMKTAVSSLQSANSSLEETRQAEESLGKNVEIYQWLALIGILGNVAGVSIRFI